MEQLASLFEKFSTLVGIQADRLWPQLVRVWWISNLTYLLYSPVLIVMFTWLSWKTGTRAAAIHDDDTPVVPSEVVYWLICSVSGAAATAALLVYIFSLASVLTAVWYPEASYVESLLKAAQK